MPYKDPEKARAYKSEYYQKNRERLLEQAREYNLRTKEVRSQKTKEYYKKNKEEIKQRVKEYRDNHKKECLERANKWRKENPEKRKEILKRYYDKKKEEEPEYFNKKAMEHYHKDVEKSRKKLRDYRKKNPIKTRYWKYKRRIRCDFTVVDKEHMTEEFKKGVLIKIREQDFRCLYCGKDVSEDYSLDHRIPLSRGGDNTVENIDIVCKDCNTKKSTRTKEEYLEVVGSMK